MEYKQCRAELGCDELHEWVIDEEDGELESSWVGCEEEHEALEDCENRFPRLARRNVVC